MEQGLAIRKIAPNLFESTSRPWTWPNSPVVPGGILIALAVNAAYETLAADFSLESLHTHFLLGPRADQPLQQRVSVLSDGGRFASRAVTVEQDGKIVVNVTCTFVRAKAMAGPSMTHDSPRKTTQTINDITLDDLDNGDGQQRYMQFQRLSVVPTSPDKNPADCPPQDLTYLCAARISPSIASRDPKIHALGMLCLSDFHVLDAAPVVHQLSVGQFRINDSTRTPTFSNIERMTSTQHSVRFHTMQDIEADSLCYVEVNVPWAGSQRAEMQSRIYDSRNRLIATCSQLAFYVLKPEDRKSSNKL